MMIHGLTNFKVIPPKLEKSDKILKVLKPLSRLWFV
jgi:hypothetical protein